MKLPQHPFEGGSPPCAMLTWVSQAGPLLSRSPHRLPWRVQRGLGRAKRPLRTAPGPAHPPGAGRGTGAASALLLASPDGKRISVGTGQSWFWESAGTTPPVPWHRGPGPRWASGKCRKPATHALTSRQASRCLHCAGWEGLSRGSRTRLRPPRVGITPRTKDREDASGPGDEEGSGAGFEAGRRAPRSSP